jgi:hypothetical protein
MGTLTDYFQQKAYTPQYLIGDRVFGRWNKIPFIGTVGTDSVVSLEQGPRVTVFVDLPIKYQKKYHQVIAVTHKDIKPLKKFDK